MKGGSYYSLFSLKGSLSEEVLLIAKTSPAAPCYNLYKGAIRLQTLSQCSNTLIKDDMKRSVLPLPSLSDDVFYPGRDYICCRFPQSVRRGDQEVKIRTKYGKKINLGLFIPMNKRVIL